MVIPVLDNQTVEAKALARTLDAPLVSDIPDSYYLTFSCGDLVVKSGEWGDRFQLSPQLFNEFERIKKQKINPKKDLFCRALGFSGQKTYQVFDGTLGFAKDAVFLLSLGAQVVGYEKSPILFQLLSHSKHHLPLEEAAFQIFQGDSLHGLSLWAESCDVVYLDPMFENIKKKSAPKKNLAFLRSLSLSETNVPLFIEKSFEMGIKRVVVKRPLNSQTLYEKPKNSYSGKIIRYDVYMK